MLAVVPFWIERVISISSGNGVHGGGGGSGMVTVMKALRMLRLLKLSRQYDGSIVIYRALRVSLAALGVPFYFLAVAVVVFASFLFYLEQQGARMNGDCQAGNCGAAFHSIPHAIWFMLVTMTTVGYGDVSPNTELGRMVTVFAMIFGVLFLSMPLAIVGNNFAAIWEDRSRVIFIEKFKESFATKKVDRATLQTVFEDLDTDGSGTLSFKELKVSLTKINVRMSAYAFKQLWRAIDSDNSGEIGFEEFTRLFFEARGARGAARAARRARRSLLSPSLGQSRRR